MIKFIKTSLILLVFIPSVVNAQADSLMEQLRYYPLQIGDYWEYKTRSSMFGGETITAAYSVEVTGDKILPNGILYKRLVKESIGSGSISSAYYQRVDSSNGYVYQYASWASETNYEIAILNLFAHPLEVLDRPPPEYNPSIENTTILDVPTTVQTFLWVSGPLSSTRIKYAKGFGYSGMSRSTPATGYTEDLAYAKINGIAYGIRILTNSQIEQLHYYPLQSGDQWQYKTKFDSLGEESISAAYSVEVIRDTTLPNGNLYKVLINESICLDNSRSEYYQRVDSFDGYIYQYSSSASETNYEVVILNLFSQPWGTIEYPPHTDPSIENTSVLDVPTTVQTFFWGGSPNIWTRTGFAKGFGYSGMSRSRSSSFYREDLVSARINGISYGKKIQVPVISSSYPPSDSISVYLGEEIVFSVNTDENVLYHWYHNNNLASTDTLFIFIPGKSDLGLNNIRVMISNDPYKTYQTWIVEVKQPEKFKLSQNYPNPFNSQTTIPFQIDTNDNIKLTVYDINGRMIKKLFNGFLKSGKEEVFWMGDNDSGKPVSSGVYFCLMKNSTSSHAIKLVLLR